MKLTTITAIRDKIIIAYRRLFYRRPRYYKSYLICDDTDIFYNIFPADGILTLTKGGGKTRVKSYISILDRIIGKLETKKHYKESLTIPSGLYLIEAWKDGWPMIVIEDIDKYLEDPVYKMLSNAKFIN